MQDLFKEIIILNTNNFIWKNQQLKIKSFHDLKEEHKKDIFKRSIIQFCNENNFDEILSNRPLFFEYGKIYFLSKPEITALLYINTKQELSRQISRKTKRNIRLLPFIMFAAGLILGMGVLIFQ